MAPLSLAIRKRALRSGLAFMGSPASQARLRAEPSGQWNDDDFEKLKNTLDDVIQLVRFVKISREDFLEKVKPYKRIFDEEVYKEILGYHFAADDEWRRRPISFLRKDPRTRIEKGKLLNFYLH